MTFLYHRDPYILQIFFLLYNRFLELLSKPSDQNKHKSFTIEVFHVLRPINMQRSFLAGFFLEKKFSEQNFQQLREAFLIDPEWSTRSSC